MAAPHDRANYSLSAGRAPGASLIERSQLESGGNIVQQCVQTALSKFGIISSPTLQAKGCGVTH